jgi:hypothetical protein
MLVRLFINVTKYLRKLLKRQNFLFWLIISEVSVHSSWLSYFWIVIRQNIMVAGTLGKGYLPHDGQEAERETMMDIGQIQSPKTCPTETYFLHLGSTS